MVKLKETILMLNRFKGLPQFIWMEELLSRLEAKFHLKGSIVSRTTKIDEIVSETQLQIQKLKEYKTSVISEVVTGKVDVREWKAPSP